MKTAGRETFEPQMPSCVIVLSMRHVRLLAVYLLFCVCLAPAQVIEFESGGLIYQTLTRNGLTVMFAQLPALIREYSVVQVAVSNGSSKPLILKLDDFTWVRADGTVVRPSVPRYVVQEFLDKAGRNEVTKLVSAYEQGLYGMKNLRSTSGYEQRRLSALAEVSSAKLKAAAAASAIAFVPSKLVPGESTDGALFLVTNNKPLGSGKLRVLTNGMLFDFNLTEEQPKVLGKPDSH